jgi:hypothetical protein
MLNMAPKAHEFLASRPEVAIHLAAVAVFARGDFVSSG